MKAIKIMASNSQNNKSAPRLYGAVPRHAKKHSTVSNSYLMGYPTEGGAYDWPKEIRLSSNLIMNKETLREAGEFLEKAHYLKNLWQPDREVGDVKRALAYAERRDEEEKRKQHAA